MLNHRFFTSLLCALLLFPALAGAAADLLPPQKAFVAQVERHGNSAELVLTTALDYYVYSQRTQISTDPPTVLGQISLPPGHQKNDPFLGTQQIYTGQVRIPLPLNAAPQDFLLNVKLQGCAEIAKVCYAPYTHALQVGPNGSQAPHLFLSAGGGQTDAAPAEPQSTGLILGGFYLAGLALAFTACMCPLLPILSSLIAGQGAQLTRRRGLLLSMSYVQGLALCYTLIGVIAALTGSLLTVWLQQPIVVLSAAALMVAFALAMFGVWTMQLPSAWQTALTRATNRLPGGQYLTVFATGALSALLIGPCVAPPLALALALGYIAGTGDALLGGLALYVMALGLGTPLLIVGFFGGTMLPRAGAWMQGVKNLFGLVMLGLAIYMAAPFLPPSVALLLWGALAAACAVWLLIRQRNIRYRLDELSGIALALVALTQFTVAATGGNDPLRPLPPGWFGHQTAQAAPLTFQPIQSLDDWQRVLQQNAGQPVLLDFYADWCVACKELERDTFTDPAVAESMRGYVLVRADVTANSPQHQALLKHFGLFGPPGVVLIGADGRETGRIIGFMPPDEFLLKLKR